MMMMMMMNMNNSGPGTPTNTSISSSQVACIQSTEQFGQAENHSKVAVLEEFGRLTGSTLTAAVGARSHLSNQDMSQVGQVHGQVSIC